MKKITILLIILLVVVGCKSKSNTLSNEEIMIINAIVYEEMQKVTDDAEEVRILEALGYGIGKLSSDNIRDLDIITTIYLDPDRAKNHLKKEKIKDAVILYSWDEIFRDAKFIYKIKYNGFDYPFKKFSEVAVLYPETAKKILNEIVKESREHRTDIDIETEKTIPRYVIKSYLRKKVLKLF